MTGRLCLSAQQYMGTCFKLGKDKAGKGEGWALPFSCCVRDTVGLYTPWPLWLLGYKESLPLPFRQLMVMDESYVINQLKEDVSYVSTQFNIDMQIAR